MKNSFKIAGLMLLAMPIAGCATDRTFGQAQGIEITNLDALPQPDAEIYYAIGPQETLEITVVGAEDLSGTYFTDQEGAVFFPLLGEVALGGASPNAAARIIANGLRGNFILDPQVRVVPESFPVPSISIGGEVEKPGEYPALGKLTLLRAVNQAEGLSEYAKMDDVLIMRTVSEQKYIGVYNIQAIQRGNYPDPLLYPNDIVMVGDSPARRRLDNILQFAPLLTSSAIVIDRLGN